MERKKGIFLIGVVTGILLMLLTLTIHQVFASQPITRDVQLLIDRAIERASPSVVGIVNHQQGLKQSTGSGVIYRVTSDTTYIVTNYHVVQGADRVEVVFMGDRREEGTLVGFDFLTDLAILSVKRHASDQPIPIATDEATTGDFVLAIGNPLGLDLYGTITLGIVSSDKRYIPIDYDRDGEYDFLAQVIQTDAAINPGNSGGALVNLAGELIGINSMKIAGAQVEGLGFSIPASVVLHVIQQLEMNGQVIRPYLGVQLKSIANLAKEDQQRFDVAGKSGLLVIDVRAGSPAERGGLAIGDIITHMNGERMEQVAVFRTKLYQQKVYNTVTLTVMREEATYELEVKLSKRP